mgnify:CR=1 FL=1
MFFFKKAQSRQALVRQGVGGTQVSLDKINVYPVLHRVDTIDLSLKALTLKLTEANAMLCKDYIKADVHALFYVKVRPMPDDIRHVASTFDTQQLNNLEYLGQYFLPKFEEALRINGQRFDFADLFKHREEFRNHTLEIIGVELGGFSLEDMVIDHLEQTSLDFYNPEDYLEERGKGKVKSLVLENQLQKVRSDDENDALTIKTEIEAQEVTQRYELEVAKAKVQHKLELAKLEAEKEFWDNADKKTEEQTEKKDAIDQEIEAVRAKARAEKERIEQLYKQQEEQNKSSKQ